MESHLLWQWITHYGYVVLTIIGSVIVLGFVVRDRRKERNKY